MGNTKNKDLHIEIASIEEDKPLNCPKICNRCEDCYIIGDLEFGTENAKGIKMSHAYLIIQNLSDEPISIESDNFTAIDDNGFSYNGAKFGCNYYGSKKEYYTERYELHPSSKVRFLVLFKSKTISRIIYSSIFDDYYYDLTVNDKKECHVNIDFLRLKLNEANAVISNLKEELSTKIKETNRLQEELEECTREKERLDDYCRENYSAKAIHQRRMEELLCKYEEIEDDDYYRVISLEEHDTASFNREFDKSKGNYNWINEGDALISLRADNTGYGLDGRTIIKSHVSGIFEFNKNKMIGYKEEICRVRKYPQKMKNEIINELEKQEIKENVYKKERKKMIEREVLDELIEEGKVFNVYTKKDGNRTTIPMDIANAVWNRDGGKCCMCGSKENLEFDHIIPISKGGATTFRNLQILCKNCNIKKSDNI